MNDKPIPKAVLKVVRERTCRRVAAAIITAMAETDTGIDVIAARLGKKSEAIKVLIDRLIAGQSASLDKISEILWAMGCELAFSLTPAKIPHEPDEEV